jgi:uncharacterized membrane protein
MKKFTIISLCSAILALGAQAIIVCIFVVSTIIQTNVFIQVHAQIPTAQLSTAPQDKQLDAFLSIFVFTGIGLAVVSLIAAIMSFIKREAGWRFLPVTLLILYLMTWLAILCWAKSQG